MSEADDCDHFVISQYAPLSRLAALLVTDGHLDQVLAQETLIRVVQKWPAVRRADDPVAYTRKIMLNQFLASRRRHWHREEPVAEPPDDASTTNVFDGSDTRDELRRALTALPPRQRAAVVLRHYEQRSEAQTSALMGCSVGTVKSLTSRGLASLRVGMAAQRMETP